MAQGILSVNRRLHWQNFFAAIAILLFVGSTSRADVPATAMDAISNPRLAEIIAGRSHPQGLEDLKEMQSLTQRLSDKVMPVTVGVQVGPSQGSGVIISKDGYVLTAAHVSAQANRDATFMMADGRILRGKTLGLNRSMDAGLMKINEGGDFPYASLGDSNILKEGQWCVAVGHPGGYQPDRKPVIRLGRLLVLTNTNLTTDCTLVGGDSGGPLFDFQGNVIGINSKIQESLESNMHVPCNTFRDTWDRLVKGDAWGHYEGQKPYIGLRGEPGDDQAKVAKVAGSSPAAKAGIKEGDIIVSVDDVPVKNFAAVTAAISEHQPGEKVRMRIRRNETLLELSVLISKKNG